MKLPSSITTWVIQAVGVSPLPFGVCVADNVEIISRRDIFLDVTMPYSVMRQEQAYIRVTLYYHVATGLDFQVNIKTHFVASFMYSRLKQPFWKD